MYKNKLQKKIQENKPQFIGIPIETKVSTNIFTFDLSSSIDSTQVSKNVLEYKNKYPESNSTYVNAWHSFFYTHKNTNLFDDLITIVENKVSIILQNRSKKAKAKVAQSWVIIYNKGGYTKPHIHFDTTYTAVYYAKVEENPSPLLFTPTIKIFPKESMLVCFPGYLEHSVPKMENDGERIVVAFNLNCLLRENEDE